jgi:hypothetical protein
MESWWRISIAVIVNLSRSGSPIGVLELRVPSPSNKIESTTNDTKCDHRRTDTYSRHGAR